MNRSIAAVYAITIGSGGEPYTAEEKTKLVQVIPALIEQVQRLDRLLADPFIRGYIQRFGEPGAGNNG